MSDVPQGPDWWRASNGLYYPPEARPASPVDRPRGPERDEAGLDSTTLFPTGSDDRSDPAERSTEPTERRPDPAERSTEPVAASGGGSDRTVVERRETERDVDAVHEPESVPRRRGRVAVVLLAVVLVAALAGLVVWWVLGDTDDPGDTTETVATDAPTTTPPDEAATTEPDQPDPDEPEPVSVFDLAVGNCFDTDEVDEADELTVTTVVLVECDGPHRAVVFDIAELDAPPGEPFPGSEARDASAQELCAPGFEEYVGAPLAESDLIVLWLAPTPRTWEEEDDREVTCAVARAGDEMLTGPVAGSGL